MDDRTIRREKRVEREAPDTRNDLSTSYGRGQSLAPTSTSEKCPRCGAEVASGADYCEACGSYIAVGTCSFCGSAMTEDAAFCPECGNSRQGLTCPVCHRPSIFAFCKHCGTALTDEARAEVARYRATPEAQAIAAQVQEIISQENILPIRSERDAVKDSATANLARRVAELLAADEGRPVPAPREVRPRPTAAELEAKKAEAIARLTAALEGVARQAGGEPIAARNYICATKPQGIKTAWLCNYQHAMHPSPCECAKPHLGGRWIVIK